MHQLRDAGYNIWYDEGVAASNEWQEEIAKQSFAAFCMLYFTTSH